MRRLNDIDWKALILDHGEKALLGLVLVFVLGSLATTRWSTYDKTPEEFQTRIHQGESAFNASRWPAHQKATFFDIEPELGLVQPGQETVQEASLFKYSTRWIWPLRKRQARLREPEFPAVQKLIAGPGKMLVYLRPESDDARQFKLDAVAPDPTPAAAEQPAASGIPPLIEPPRPDSQNSVTEEENEYGEDIGDLPGPEDQNTPRQGEARGMRFVSVRGVIPVEQIVEQFRDALNLDSTQEAFAKVQFWDFELERMTAVPGTDPWDTEWEAVDISETLRLLDRMDFDLDIVEDKYRNPVFIMPLPYRFAGDWNTARGPHGLLASHPAIRTILTKQEQLAQETLKLATLKAARKTEEFRQEQKAGFEFIQHNTQAMRTQMSDNQAMLSLLYESIQEVLEQDMANRGVDREQVLALLHSQIGTSGTGMNIAYPTPGRGRGPQFVSIPELMLFRFLDFNVVPGNAYRYRVRLKLKNPNFGRDPSEVVDASMREGRFRHTPWSEPTPPTVVDAETHLFVEKVDERRGVAINVYQWLTDSGTYASALFEGLKRAERLAAWTFEKRGRRGALATLDGGIVTDILRPVEKTFRKERIDYVTPHSLIDYQRTSVITADEFPSLDVSPKRVSLALEEVVTLNRFGEVNHISSDRQRQSYEDWQALLERQKTVWQHLRGTTPPTGSKINLPNVEAGSQPQAVVPGRVRGSGKRRLGESS